MTLDLDDVHWPLSIDVDRSGNGTVWSMCIRWVREIHVTAPDGPHFTAFESVHIFLNN